jgi:hypothetical protein
MLVIVIGLFDEQIAAYHLGRYWTHQLTIESLYLLLYLDVGPLSDF